MKKIILLFTAFLSISSAMLAQAYEGTIQYDKKKQAAIVIDYDYPSQAVENAIVKQMEQSGFKVKEEKGLLNRDKGFLVFKNAYITDISKDRMDYIIKVEQKSKKDNEESTLYMIMSKDGNNALAGLSAYDAGAAKTYLNNMIPEIEAANLELNIKAQVEVVAKAEKKLKSLQDDKIELEKKLAENVKSQDDTIKDIEAQKKALETLVGKRKKD